MQLNIVRSKTIDGFLNLSNGMINKYRDLSHRLGGDACNLSRIFKFNKPLARTIKVQPERISAGSDGGPRIVDIGYAADLDSKHGFIIRGIPTSRLADQPCEIA